MTELYKKTSYTQDIPILVGDIYEYDISKANISVLYDKGLIDYSKYSYLYNEDSMVRKVIVGNMQRDNPNLTKQLQQGIIEAKYNLFTSNNLTDEEVLSIKNDAVFSIRLLEFVSFRNIVFKLKNHYKLFIKVYKLEFYYNDYKLDVKGIQDDVLDIHKDYMVAFFKELFDLYLKQGCKNTIDILQRFYEAYNNRVLDPGFYRDLYTGKFQISMNSIYSYESTIYDKSLLPFILIDNNNAILRGLARIFYSEYLR